MFCVVLLVKCQLRETAGADVASWYTANDGIRPCCDSCTTDSGWHCRKHIYMCATMYVLAVYVLQLSMHLRSGWFQLIGGGNNVVTYDLIKPSLHHSQGGRLLRQCLSSIQLVVFLFFFVWRYVGSRLLALILPISTPSMPLGTSPPETSWGLSISLM